MHCWKIRAITNTTWVQSNLAKTCIAADTCLCNCIHRWDPIKFPLSVGDLDPFLAPTQLVPQTASQSVNHSLLILWCNLQSCEKTIQHYLPFGPCDWTAIMASSLRYFLISDRKSAICWSYTNNARADLTDIFLVDWVIRQPIWSYGRLLAWW